MLNWKKEVNKNVLIFLEITVRGVGAPDAVVSWGIWARSSMACCSISSKRYGFWVKTLTLTSFHRFSVGLGSEKAVGAPWCWFPFRHFFKASLNLEPLSSWRTHQWTYNEEYIFWHCSPHSSFLVPVAWWRPTALLSHHHASCCDWLSALTNRHLKETSFCKLCRHLSISVLCLMKQYFLFGLLPPPPPPPAPETLRCFKKQPNEQLLLGSELQHLQGLGV